MALTREFRQTVLTRLRNDPAFREALALEEIRLGGFIQPNDAQQQPLLGPLFHGPKHKG